MIILQKDLFESLGELQIIYFFKQLFLHLKIYTILLKRLYLKV